MKKRTLPILVAAFLLRASGTMLAQENVTFSAPGTGIFADGVVKDDATETIFVYGRRVVPNKNSEIDATVVMKLDPSGSLVAGQEFGLQPSSIKAISTNDHGLLLCGFARGAEDSLCVIKLTNNLEQQWALLFPVGEYLQMDGQYRLNVTRLVGPSGQEHYYVQTPHHTTVPTFEEEDVAFAVAKIGDDGTVYWRHAYMQASRAAYGASAIRDYCAAITPVVLEGGSEQGPTMDNAHLLLGGYRQEWTTNGEILHKLYFMYINQEGFPVGPYQTFPTIPTPGYFANSSYPHWPNVIQDGQELVCSYLEGNCTIAQSPNNASGIGVFKMDLALNPYMGKYIWLKGENYPYSLVKNVQGHYVINASIFPFQTTATDHQDMAQLSLDPTSLTTISLHRYNKGNDYVFGVPNWMTTDKNGDNYQVETVYDPSTPTVSIRYVHTDGFGKTCGADPYKPNEISIKDYTVFSLPYGHEDVLNYVKVDFPQQDFLPDIRSCNEDKADFYRSLAPVAAKAGDITVLPTLVRAGEAVTITVAGGQAAECVLVDGVGRVVRRQPFTGSLALSTVGLQPGVYVAQVVAQDGTSKAVRLQVAD